MDTRIKSFILLLLFLSCGKKEEEEKFSLIDSWDLTNVDCFTDFSTGTIEERYSLSNSKKVSIAFEGRNMSYKVDSSTCSTSASGKYRIKYSKKDRGDLDFLNIGECDNDCTIAITPEDLTGSVSVPFGLLASKATNLEWHGDEDNGLLYIKMPTGFKGGESMGTLTGSACDFQKCECFYLFEH